MILKKKKIVSDQLQINSNFDTIYNLKDSGFYLLFFCILTNLVIPILLWNVLIW